jgi:hypothetical protein
MRGFPIYKTVPYWRKYKLCPFLTDGQWSKKIDLYELVWYKVLDNLRELGYSVKNSKIFTDLFFVNKKIEILKDIIDLLIYNYETKIYLIIFSDGTFLIDKNCQKVEKPHISISINHILYEIYKYDPTAKKILEF